MSVNVDPNQWRLSTPNGIPYKALELSGQFGAEDASATEVVLIQASQLLAFAEEMFPQTYISTGTIIRPRRRALPGMAPLVAKTFRWEAHTDGRPVDPFGGDSDAPADTYEQFLKLTIEYGTSSSNDEEENPDDPRTFLEISSNAGGVFLAVKPVNATWVGIGDEPASSPVREQKVPQTQTEPQTEWSVRWSQIDPDFFDETLIARLRDKLGKVNQGEMTTLYDAPAETILFAGYTLREQYTWREGATGASPVAIDMKFVEKNLKTADPNGFQVTHNHVYRPGFGYRRLLVDGDPLYATTDLDNIFSGQ
jgi:hypothetical protein